MTDAIVDLYTRRAPPAPTPDQEPPHSLEAEQALLGALLVNNAAYERVADLVLPAHFADPVHGDIYEAIAGEIERGRSATPVTLQFLFASDPRLADCGGAGYLVRLAAAVITVANAADYARQIRDCFLRREMIAVAEEMKSAAFLPGYKDRGGDWIETDPAHLIAAGYERLDELASVGKPKGDLVHVKRGLTAALATAEAAYVNGPEAAGLSSGISDLDAAIGMLAPGALYIGGGRPGMGKSTIGMRIGRNVAARGLPVAFFSLEMPEEQCASMLLAGESGISQERQKLGEMTAEEFDRLCLARDEIAKWPFHIDDTPASTVHEIRRRAIKLRRRHGLALIVIDYLQLIAPGNTRRNRQTNRTNDLTEISGALKALAKELGVPVIALAQLSRAVEGREDKRPQLSDLRESGSIEQDADVVFFPWRQEYYLDQSEPVSREGEDGTRFADRHDEWTSRLNAARNVMEVIVGKRRAGRPRNARLYANMETGVITNGSF